MFDSPLITKLLHYFVPSINAPSNGWDKLPDENDQSEEAHMVRLVLNRHNVQHTTGYVPEPLFKKIATSMIKSMVALGENKKSFDDILPPLRYKIVAPVSNFNFREQEIKEIHDAVENCNMDKLWLVIHALAGTGKSEIARKYAEEYRSYYSGNCVWIKSSSSQSLETAFIEIAKRCELQIRDDNGNLKGIDYIITKVHEHLRLDPVLFIFDDVVATKDIQEFLPDYPSSVSLITTQLANWSEPEYKVKELKMFNADESGKFLVDCIKEEHKQTISKETLEELLSLLGGHPLALQQFSKAASNFSKNTLGRFITDFKSKLYKSLNLNMSLPTSNVSATAAISINIERFRTSNDTELAITILDTAVYLDITEISMEVIEMLFNDCDILDVTNAIQQLHSRSLLNKRNTSESVQILTIHSLVQETVLMLYKKNKCTNDDIVRNSMDGHFFHSSFGENWTKHFLYIMTTIDIDDTGLMNKLNDYNIYCFLESKGKLFYFKEFLERFVNIITKEKKTNDDINRLSALSYLGHCYQEIGQAEKAILSYEEVSEIQSKVLGPDHPKVLLSLNHLANSYQQFGQIEKAISIHQLVSEKRSKILGADHPDTLSSLNNLVICFKDIGQIEKAILIQKDVSEKLSNLVGRDNPDTLSSIYNLAVCYDKAGQIEKAVSINEEVSNKRSEVLGPVHPDTLTSLNSLAISYREIGRIEKSISIFADVLKKRSKVLGPKHPDTLLSRSNLEWCEMKLLPCQPIPKSRILEICDRKFLGTKFLGTSWNDLWTRPSGDIDISDREIGSPRL